MLAHPDQDARSAARQANLDRLQAVLAVALDNLSAFTRRDQARILNAAVALEDEGEARVEVILDLMDKLIEVTSE